jgi:hypothetical protein
MIHIDDVKADDVPAALDFFRQCVKDGTWSSDLAEVLLNRQSDPRTLLAMMGATAADPEPASPTADRRPPVAKR